MNTEQKYNTVLMIFSEKLDRFTAIDIMRKYQAILHETINWHEFSYLLDELYIKGVLNVSGHNRDGMTIYKVKVVYHDN